MDRIIQKTTEERYQYFLIASEKINLPVQIVEKDFWVCFILGVLFKIPELSTAITFKGGTSLSKVYRVINRFSEDVDISIDKSFFGFTGSNDPEQVTSRKQRKLLIAGMSAKCQEYVTDVLLAKLNLEIKKILVDQDWSLELDTSDIDLQTLTFIYPQGASALKSSAYILSSIKLEFGCRGEHWPTIESSVDSYLGEALDFERSKDLIRVLDIARTFWEKATILHMYANFPKDKQVSLRQSRHYYDLYTIINSDYFDKISSDLTLLKRVAEYKNIYFRSSWANYLEAEKCLRLIPAKPVLGFMRDDYGKMREMFFNEPPKWEDVIQTLADYQNSINILQEKDILS